MEWTEWSRWFSYGRFERAGIFRGKVFWIFDKQRIRHELMSNLHRFRYCPYIRPGLINAVLSALPDKVEVTDQGPWKYSPSYEELPGSIKVVEVDNSSGFESKSEYYADGVRPRGLIYLKGILQKAFADAGVSDISVSELVQ